MSSKSREATVAKERKAIGDYDIGYGKTPVHSRFQAGASGNPNGRPKDSKNLKTLARKVMNTKVPVREGGKVRMISKAEALVMTVFNRGLAGNDACARAALNLMQLALVDTDASGVSPESLALQSQDDLIVLGELAKRYGGEVQRSADAKSQSKKPRSRRTAKEKKL
jgi:hypothetical protein